MGLGTARKTLLKNDKLGKSKQAYVNDYMLWGDKHEVNGIAKWVSIHKKMPKKILDEQESIKHFNWHEGMNLSTTPDGIAEDCLIEVKCSALGKKTYPEFPEEHYWQVYGQQMVMNCEGYEIKKTHLVNWTPKHTKIWEIERNLNFEKYMSGLLQEYINCLISDKDIVPKPKPYSGDHKIKLIYNNGETHGKS